MKSTIIQAAVTVTILGLALLGACNDPHPQRLNAPPQRHTDAPAATSDHFTAMTDNAMLEEMSMSPAHFAPKAAELNGLGARRLNRYAEIIKVHGGELHYDGCDSKELTAARLDQMREYLVASGVGPDRFKAAAGPAGGGMRATESVEVRRATLAVTPMVIENRDRVILEDGPNQGPK